MPNVPSAKKRLKQSLKARERNRQYRAEMKTFVKKAQVSITASDKETAAPTVADALKKLDKIAQKGIIHKNKAARKKSRLMKKFNSQFS